MKPAEILQNVLDILNIEYSTLAHESGLAHNTLANILNGRTKGITERVATAIVMAHPNISKRFLLAGQGSPYADGRHWDPGEPVLSPADVVRSILTHYHISQANFALVSNQTRGEVSNILHGDRKPYTITATRAKKIEKAFPELSVEWIMTGRGAMFKDGKPAPVLPVIGEESKPKTPEYVSKEEYDSLNDKLNQMLRMINELRDSQTHPGIAAEDLDV